MIIAIIKYRRSKRRWSRIWNIEEIICINIACKFCYCLNFSFWPKFVLLLRKGYLFVFLIWILTDKILLTAILIGVKLIRSRISILILDLRNLISISVSFLWIGGLIVYIEFTFDTHEACYASARVCLSF